MHKNVKTHRHFYTFRPACSGCNPFKCRDLLYMLSITNKATIMFTYIVSSVTWFRLFWLALGIFLFVWGVSFLYIEELTHRSSIPPPPKWKTKSQHEPSRESLNKKVLIHHRRLGVFRSNASSFLRHYITAVFR